MTTASKFGAQDLNGNPFNYQQLVAPVSANNVVVNANFANRNSSDAKVRLAATSVPLVSQTVASTQGLLPYTTTASAASATIPTLQTITVSNTTVATNQITTASILVTSTSAVTNNINCVSTASLVIGEPVVFSNSLGNLSANVLYYVVSIPSITTFTVSATFGGIPVTLVNATGNINVQEATTNLSVNEPIMFTGGAFGGINTGITYYVLTIDSFTSFTVSTMPSGPAVTLFTATGVMTLAYSTIPTAVSVSSTVSSSSVSTLQALTISNTTTTTNVFTTVQLSVNATSATGNLITTTSLNGGTTILVVGQPIVFTGTMTGSNLTAGTIYYVQSIQSTTTFTVSTTWGGSAVVLGTTGITPNVQQATTNLVVNQPMMFAGVTFGGVVANTTYYVSTIPSSTTFTVSTVPSGTVLPLLTATGTMVFESTALSPTLSVGSTASTVTPGSIAVTATAVTTNLITCANTSTLGIGQPVIFNSSIDALIAGTTYYVSTVPSITTFTVSLVPNGSVVTMAGVTGANILVFPQQTLNVGFTTNGSPGLTTAAINITNTTTGTNLVTATSTIGIYVGMPITFTSSIGNIIANNLYYVQSVPTTTTFTISSTLSGPVFILSTAATAVTAYQAVTNLLVNQPVTFSTGSPTQYLRIGSTAASGNLITTGVVATVASTAVSGNIITCNDTSLLVPGMPVLFGTAGGGLATGTTYYVATVLSSTTFTVTITTRGNPTLVTLSAATFSSTVTVATSNMIVNQPIVFTGTGVVGNIVAGTTYYVASIPSTTTFTISTAPGGTAFTLVNGTPASLYSMVADVTMLQYPLTIGATTVTSNIITTSTINVTASSATGNLITCASTTTLVVGQSVVFAGTVSTSLLVAGTIYYVQSIPSTTTFTISATLNGSVFTIGTAATLSMTVQQATVELVVNQPIAFNGTGFGNVAANTIYYVSNVVSATTFTVSSIIGGTAIALSTTTGTLTSNPQLLGNLLPRQTYYVQGVIGYYSFTVSATNGGQPISFLSTTYGMMKASFGLQSYTNSNVLTTNSLRVTATTVGTNVITIASTATLTPTMPVVFSNDLGTLVANTVYYVISIPSATTFTVSTRLNGSIYPMQSASGTVFLQQSTASLAVNQPIVFTSGMLPLTIASTTTGTNVLTTSAINVTATSSTGNTVTCSATSTLAIGMPVVFTGTMTGSNLTAGTVYYVATIPTGTTFTVAATLNGVILTLGNAPSITPTVQQTTTNLVLNQPIVFTGTTFGQIVAGTTYYVSTVPSSTTFTVSASINGSVFSLLTSSGVMTAGLSTIGGITPNITYYVASLPTLTSFTVAAFHSGPSVALTNFNGLMNATVTYPVPTLVISNSNSTGNILTTASVAVTATTTTTNLITCTSTSTFVIGQAVVFSAASGGLIANTTYYIASIPSATTFTVSTSLYGSIVALTTTAPTMNVQQATSQLVLNQPFMFTTGGAFGNLSNFTIYYIQSIPSLTTVTLSTAYGGPAITLTTTSGQTGIANVGPHMQYSATNTTVSTNVITTTGLTFTGSVAGTNLVTTSSSTYTMWIGMPVVFTTAVGAIATNIVYYVQSIPSFNTFAVSLVLGGPQVILSQSSTTGTFYEAVSNYTIGQGVVFTGTTFGGITAGTVYYIQSLPNLFSFTISTAPNGGAVGLSTASGFMTYTLLATNVTAINALVTSAITVTSTTVNTNIITCTSTSRLVHGQSVIFSGSLGGLLPNTTYYITSIPSDTTFVVSLTSYGIPVQLTTATGSITVQQSTASLAVGNPVIFNSPIMPIVVSSSNSGTNAYTTASIAVTATALSTNLITCASTSTLNIGQPVVFSGALGTIVSGTVYYVKQILSTTQFTISATLNGTVFVQSAASGSVNVQQATTGLVVNQPIVFTGTSFGGVTTTTVTYYINSIVSLTSFTISSSHNGSVFTLTTTTGTMTGTFTAFGGLTINTIYYIASIISPISFTLTTIYGTAPAVLTLGAGALMCLPMQSVPSLTIASVTVTTNLLTTFSTTVSATSTGTNFITCTSTLNFAYGQPVIFTGTTFGGLTATSVTYYILNIIDATRFTVSLTLGGSAVVLTSATGTCTIQQSTANLIIGQPIVFWATVLNTLVYGTTYYVNAIISTTTFTISSVQNLGFSGTAFTISATVSGTFTAYYGPVQLPMIYTTTASSNLLTTNAVTCTSTSVLGNNLIVCQNTYGFYVGMPVVFTGTSFGGIVINTVYYISSIWNERAFTVSAVPNGPVFSLSYATGSMTVFPSTSNLWIGQPVTLSNNVTGNSVFGGAIVATTTYYVQSLPALNTFTVSTLPYGAAVTLSTVNYTSVASQMTIISSSMPVAVSNVYLSQTFPVVTTTSSSNILTIGNLLTNTNVPIFITSVSATTNILTCNSTATLSVGLPIVLSSGLAGLFAGTTYYIMQILNSTQFTLANSWGGQQAILTTSGIITGSTTNLTITGTSQVIGNTMNVASGQTTANLYAGLPIIFTGSVFGNVVANTTYYVLQVFNSTTFSISTSVGGTTFALGGTTGTMALTSAPTIANAGISIQPSTAQLTIGQPLYVTGAAFGNINSNITYYVNTILSPTTFTVTQFQYSNTAVPLRTEYGYMYFTNSTGLTPTGPTNAASLVANAPFIFTGPTITVTNTAGTILTTMGNTQHLSVNQPVMFTGYTIGGIQANVYYYVRSIPTFNTFTLSSTVGGSALSWSNTSNQMTMQLVNNSGTSLLPYNAYYVQAVQSPFTFSIATLQNSGVPVTLTTGFNTNIVQSNICTYASGSSTAFLAANQLLTFVNVTGGASSVGSFGNIQTLPLSTLPYVVTNTTVTSNLITVSNTSTLIPGQPVVFLGNTWGGITAYTTYYVLAISSSTQFTVSLTPFGTVATLSTVAAAAATPAYWMVPAYYVKANVSGTQFVLSATPNGSILPLLTGYATGGNMLVATGQPVFTDFIEFDSLIAGNGVLERTGIIVPPNTYLYVSSNVSQVSAVALGIQEAV